MRTAQEKPLTNLKDHLNRPIHDLRISVIDRCNFRCTYCMPENDYAKHYTFLPKQSWLSYDEIIRLVRIFVSLGTKKVRLTGGEPLLRPKIDNLITDLNKISGLDDIALTTNGVLLVEQAGHLKKAGLKRLTISLDSINDKICRRMNGGRSSVQEILDGIHEAEKAGFRNIKINTVVEKGVNDHTLIELVDYFKGSGHVLRFIEYMDVGNCNHWNIGKVVKSEEIFKRINAIYPLIPIKANYYGEVTTRYAYKDGGGEIGFVSSVTQPFCGSCTRARISPNGKLFTCLFSRNGFDLRQLLQNETISDAYLKEEISDIWKKREDNYSQQRTEFIKNNITQQKVEMFHIGG